MISLVILAVFLLIIIFFIIKKIVILFDQKGISERLTDENISSLSKKFTYDNDYNKTTSSKNDVFHQLQKDYEDKVGNFVSSNQNIEFIDNFNIEYFYHITHKDNILSILKNGLFSHNLAFSKGLNSKDIANKSVVNRRDKKDKIHQIPINHYAPLYFNPKNAMLYYLRTIDIDLVILAFDKKLIYEKDAIFTDGNAANETTNFYNKIEDLSNLNWDCLKATWWNDFPDGKRQRMAELLIKDHIPSKKINKIFCSSRQTLKLTNEILKDYNNITAEVNSKYFFTTYG